jgi:hypothetical protein
LNANHCDKHNTPRQPVAAICEGELIMRTRTNEPCEPFGPDYPKLGAAVAKWRKIANPSPAQKQAHGDAVSAAIRALQRAALARELPTIRPSCSSGTWHNNGDGSVGRAVADQHRRALLACPDAIRRARTAAEWQSLYDEAMAEKRAREARSRLVAMNANVTAKAGAA